MLRRLLRYVEGEYRFREKVDRLTDNRIRPQIPTAGVWLSVFGMFALRLGSFNALEQDLRRPRRWERLVGRRKPSADTLGYALRRFDPEPLREILRDLSRIAWRKKAIHGRPGESLRVMAVDGHELFSSRARCCDKCLVRELETEGGKVREYYHRAVVAQWVGVTPPGILDLELLGPGEGEVTAARRLLDRILTRYARLIDVVSADALYVEAPFLRQILDAGKHFVVVLKQENRDLYQDAAQLRATLAPQTLLRNGRTSRVWDLPDLTTFTTLGRSVRVLWCEEQEIRARRIGGRVKEVVEEKTWIWVTDLPAASVSPERIQNFGHDRWDLENRGFNELGELWGMDHCFVHDPTAMEVILLTLSLAFLTTYLFYERNLKPALRRHMTRLALAARLAEDFLTPEPLWPEPQLSG